MKQTMIVKKGVVVTTLFSFLLALFPVDPGWAKEDSFLRPKNLRSADGGERVLALQDDLTSSLLDSTSHLKTEEKKTNGLLTKSRSWLTRGILVAVLSFLLALPSPAFSASRNEKIANISLVNALLGGVTASLIAPPGEKTEAFFWGMAGGGFSAFTTLSLARHLYTQPSGPYLLRALNAFGANIIYYASEGKKNPVRESLTNFQYPLWTGTLTLKNGLPSHYTLDVVRTGVFMGGLLTGKIQSKESLKLGVPVFKLTRDSKANHLKKLVSKSSKRGEEDSGFNSFGSIFFLPSKEDVVAHENYHVFQDDRFLLGLEGLERWNHKWSLWKPFSFQLNLPYVITKSVFYGVSEFSSSDYEKEILEIEAYFFEREVDSGSRDGGVRKERPPLGETSPFHHPSRIEPLLLNGSI